MNLAALALRAIPGAFILNSGLGKIGMPAEVSAGMQEFAATGMPLVKQIPADKFGTVLGFAETAVAASLLLPFVPNRIAGLALTGFGSGLLSLYFGNDGNTESDNIRPTEAGLPLAKDSWLVAMGLALLAGVNDKEK
ncbi:hypothetical protein [Corynebacterium epidermidicanis]|uniref:DoxX protein n=1 Tax=Corynebacterium epidermidicanis TaxID=1050174 RepID=A0A0G3GW11_9CORY|nr:hypothetical protein [Corynebacterium epidermidicanis]AKK03693.1 hypothetical protein CEPID_09235 [Corynebacterium epidermidicanis]